MEKQKLNILIILENNSEVYSKASATKGVTGEVLLQLCEARLIT
jgi:hypothetical protein